MGEKTLLSIVITSNTEERIEDIYALLDSISAQTYQDVEVLFVAERSRDLLEKVENYVSEKSMTNTLVLCNKGEPGLSAGRNIGIRAARGEIIGFVDDDTILFPDWAAETVKAFNNDNIIGITGPAMPLWEDESMDWFPKEFYWLISCTGWDAEDRVKEVRNAWGMNMAFRREAFEKAGLFNNDFGFHKGMMAEDNEFSLRAKEKTSKKVFYFPTVKVYHRVHRYRLSGRFIRERGYWIGYSRRMMQKTVKAETPGRAKLFTPEKRLLQRIILRLFPNLLLKMFTRPAAALRSIRVSVLALSAVARGYYTGSKPAKNDK